MPSDRPWRTFRPHRAGERERKSIYCIKPAARKASSMTFLTPVTGGAEGIGDLASGARSFGAARRDFSDKPSPDKPGDGKTAGP